MANLNLFELKTCLDDLITFLDAHPRASYTTELRGPIERTREMFIAQERETSAHYIRWRQEGGQQTTSHKKLQRTTKQIQRRLALIGAQGWPDEPVNYLDEEDTRDQAEAMIAYLEERQEAIDFATESIADLRKLAAAGREGERETIEAREQWRRISIQRKQAIDRATDTIILARNRLVEVLGETHNAIQTIRWPATLAPG
ncbi:MAG: hypothetical protein AAFS10_23875 [Myxococcota bacterium]